MLTSALRALIKNLIKESFYGKKKNILTVFFISHKSDVKTFLKWIVNKCPTKWYILIYGLGRDALGLEGFYFVL